MTNLQIDLTKLNGLFAIVDVTLECEDMWPEECVCSDHITEGLNEFNRTGSYKASPYRDYLTASMESLPYCYVCFDNKTEYVCLGESDIVKHMSNKGVYVV